MNVNRVLNQSASRDWFGWWPGVVVSTDDPDKRGRVRVRAAQVYGATTEDEFIRDAELPWALPNGVHHDGAGEAWVPPVGAAVWVAFMAGDHGDPIWQGGWATATDTIPEHVSSYVAGSGPSTRVIKTENGHIFEMRWKSGETEIRIETAAGVKVRLADDAALGGPFAELLTPGLRKIRLDDTVQSAEMSTPTQHIQLLDASSVLDVLAGTGNYSFLAALTMVIGTILTLTATATVSITGALVTLVATTGVVTLGSLAGVKQAVVLQAFLAKYDLHTHTAIGVGAPTSPPLSPNLSAPGDFSVFTVVD